MLNYVILAAQLIVLVIVGVLLWQIWHLLNRKDISEDEPLGDEREEYLTRRLTAVAICAGIEAALCIAQAILRFIEGLQ